MTELDFEMVKGGYILEKEIKYYSPRYKKYVTVPPGFKSDGASGPALDIVSEAWWVHDQLCVTGKFDDGTPCSNWKASYILYDILRAEGRWFRCRSWFWGTAIGRPASNFLASLWPF